jgi:hypothetical protein
VVLRKCKSWLVCLIPAMSLMSCATKLDSKSVSDYAGRPTSVVIVPPDRLVLDDTVVRHFLDALDQSLRACGITPTRYSLWVGGTPAEPKHVDADAEILMRPISYSVAGLARSVESERFDVSFIDQRERRIVWRGAFSVSNDSLIPSLAERRSRDLIARLSRDGILKSCPQASR